MKVINNKDNFEATMRKFKKKVLESGRLQEYRERQEYEKPSIARKIAKGKAVSRWKKYIKSQELPTKLF
jgi:small subunit ribosomal protein S21